MTYANRSAAGDLLASWLTAYTGRADVVVLGLVRGGVPVAARIATTLRVPLDVLVVRKLGVPWAREVAFGALGPGGVVVHNSALEATLPPADIATVIANESAELARRERLYRRGRHALSLAGRLAIIVDDGAATGATARAAVAVARRMGAAAIVVALPVAAPDALAALRREADLVVCPAAPADFGSVSRYYDTFDQTSDAEVVGLLHTVA